MDFLEELSWRGMIHDVMPGTEDQLKKEMTIAYIGFDPTADSLHVGSFAQIMLLKRFQMSGHKPVVLVGGATGMIGDPSGRSDERNLLDEEMIRKNQEAIKNQLSKFLDFNPEKPNGAVMVNNYDWMKEFSFLDFIRDIGKHITVNYMMAKDSVKKRLSAESKSGMSFTEFTYQLVQGFDFLWLYENMNCKLQMGGSDQWGNITTGTELIRRKTGGEAYALTSPLITKADGSKFGKTEAGNVWLSAEKTSPYEFYQFWLNTSDEDAEKYLRFFTVLSKNETEELIREHREAPHHRILQKRLAEEITVMVHSWEEYSKACEASTILFGQGTAELLRTLDERTFLDLFRGVPQYEISFSDLDKGIPVSGLLVDETGIFPSRGELRRTIQANGLSLNKEKVADAEMVVGSSMLIGGKYLLAQKGKKSYYLIISV